MRGSAGGRVQAVGVVIAILALVQYALARVVPDALTDFWRGVGLHWQLVGRMPEISFLTGALVFALGSFMYRERDRANPQA